MLVSKNQEKSHDKEKQLPGVEVVTMKTDACTHSLCLTISLYSCSSGQMWPSLQYISFPWPRCSSSSWPERSRGGEIKEADGRSNG